MPRRDGTGPPWGSGPGTGKRRGMGGTRVGAGPGGDCVCPNCGTTVAHQMGQPCYQMTCLQCSAQMVRK